jgi:hypothetical protein
MGLSGGGSSSGSSQPAKVPIYPVDILNTELAGIQADTFGYDFSDKDFASRFPGLVAARDTDITKSYNELTGPLNPEVERSFVEKGLEQSDMAFGAGQEAPMSLTDKGSIGRNTAATAVAQQTIGYQDAARQNFEQLLAQNPERAFGLNGGDILNLSLLNQSNRVNAINQAKGLQQALNQGNAAAGQASRNATTGAVTGIISAALPIIAAAVH